MPVQDPSPTKTSRSEVFPSTRVKCGRSICIDQEYRRKCPAALGSFAIATVPFRMTPIQRIPKMLVIYLANIPWLLIWTALRSSV